MPVRRIFQTQNNYFQGGAQGICTVASLQWAKRCLELDRGLGSFDELLLTEHQLNALMAVWRTKDNDPVAQTEGMGLRIVGGDHDVDQFIDVQAKVNLTNPHVCIFWNHHHTMGYRVSTKHGRECEFFDIENGLWVADNDLAIRAKVIDIFNVAGYAQIEGMRIVTLP